jgi:hypothetical protein
MKKEPPTPKELKELPEMMGVELGPTPPKIIQISPKGSYSLYGLDNHGKTYYLADGSWILVSDGSELQEST